VIASQALTVLKRYWIALILLDIVNEASAEDLRRKFDINTGQIEKLKSNAETFSRGVLTFVAKLNWYLSCAP
jgi:hypothetical protein